MTGSFWPSQRWSYFHTRPSSSATFAKVFLAAIAAFHAPLTGQSVGRDNSVVRFLRGARRLNPPRPLTIPTVQVISLSALPPEEEDRESSLVCPDRALRIYFERSASFGHIEQLFFNVGNRAKGHQVTNQRLSKWIVDAITLAYSSLGLQCPTGVRAHSTRGITSS